MKSILYLFLGVLFITLSSSSCGKQKATVAVIKVVDGNNQPVAGAKVILYGSGTQGTITVNDTLSTNSEGEAVFDMGYMYQPGQAGVGVLDILVTKDGAQAQGIIKIVQEETTRETIRL